MRSRVVAAAVVCAGLLALGIFWMRSTATTPTTSPSIATTTTRGGASSAHVASPIRLSPGNVQRSDDAGAFSLEGRVLSTRLGTGIADVVVAFSGAGVISDVHSDATGHFVWSASVPGMYQLASMSAPGFVSFSPELGASPIVFNAQAGVRITGVTLFLSPGKDRAPSPHDGAIAGLATDAGVDAGHRGGRLVGTVRDHGNGKAISAFSIVTAARRGGVERGDAQSGSFFDAEGHYALEDVAPGTQCVTAYAFGHAGAAEQCVEVKAGGETRVDFELSQGSRLSGRVTDRATHRPIEGARVSVENPNAEVDTPMAVITAAETDVDGHFSIAGADTGVRSLFVTAAGHHSRVLPGQQLEADRDAPSIEIDLQPTEPGEQPSIESAGINAVVSANGDTLVIGKCTPEGGAAQAGLKEGDVLLKVDGVDFATLGMQAGVERLRGPEGSTVVVTIRRPPGDALTDVVVTRRRVVNR